MAGDILSVRILLVCGSDDDRDVMRRGAAKATLPVDICEAENAGKAIGFIDGGDVDLVFVDAAIPPSDQNRITKAARDAGNDPLVVLMVTGAGGIASVCDATAPKPRNTAEAEMLLERISHARVPCRALVVDDSSTMRSIVKKILMACRFSLELAEADDGVKGIEQVKAGGVDVVFLDYNMPGLNGLATLTELKRAKPQVDVVIMTSAQDQAIADRALRAGASAFLQKPFYPADIDAVLYARYGMMPCMKRG
jgi:DNA-binding NtrC family response regulator